MQNTELQNKVYLLSTIICFNEAMLRINKSSLHEVIVSRRPLNRDWVQTWSTAIELQEKELYEQKKLLDFGLNRYFQ